MAHELQNYRFKIIGYHYIIARKLTPLILGKVTIVFGGHKILYTGNRFVV